MIPQEHRIIAALGHLGPLVVPDLRQPRWWQRTAWKRDRAIQEALAAAGLPELDDYGRFALSGLMERHYEFGCHLADLWALGWCRALGLPHRLPWSPDVILDPRTGERSTMTAHERIQLLHEEARHGA